MPIMPRISTSRRSCWAVVSCWVSVVVIEVPFGRVGVRQAGTRAVRRPAGAGADQVDEAAVAVGVGQRLEAADQQRADAEVDVVEQRLGDLLVAADERGGVAGRAGHLGDRGPEPLVVDVALRRRTSSSRCEPSAFLLVESEGAAGRRPERCSVFARIVLGTGPGLLLGVGHDRPEADAEPGVAVVRCRGRAGPARSARGCPRAARPRTRRRRRACRRPGWRPRRRRRSRRGSASPGGPTTSRPCTR